MAQGHDHRTPAQTGSLTQWQAILVGIPPNVRIFGVVFVVIEIILAAIIPLADDETRKYIALGMIATGILCVIFLGISLLRTKPAPDTELYNNPSPAKRGTRRRAYAIQI